MKIPRKALTFDDVLLLPCHSEILPREASVASRLTRGIELNLPLLSAAMDTVTEHTTAIVMAQSGGMGFIHKNLSPEVQAAEVRKVKKHESSVIVEPVTVTPDLLCRDAANIMRERRISGLPVVRDGVLLGLVTGRDLVMEDESLPVSAVMTRDLVTASEGVSADEAKRLMHSRRVEKLPIVGPGNRLVGLITMRDLRKYKEFPYALKDRLGRLRVGAAIGVDSLDDGRVEALVAAGVDVLCVDTAHGHSKRVAETVRALKRASLPVEVVAGNVATREGARALIEAGADAVKVGVGPGSICTTRIVAGVGVPQLTAVLDACALARQANVPIIADGGIRFSGDVVKALAAGAESVMIGSLFGGTDEAPGEMVLYEGRRYKSYRGMGSIGAMRQGSADRYGQAEAEASKLVPEGIEGMVPYRGRISDVLDQMVGGLKSGMGYLGAHTLAELREHAEFVEITQAGVQESHVHDVIIRKEAPNYRR